MTKRSPDRDAVKHRGSPAAWDHRRKNRGRSLDSINRLESAIALAAPGREHEWMERVVQALHGLELHLESQSEYAESPDGLLSEIVMLQPRLANRVQQIRQQNREILRQTTSLRRQLERPTEQPPDFADARQRLAWLLAAVRHNRTRETDLIYEAFHTDIGEGD